ncbi:MAG: hypothetical protein ACT4QF_09735 [Sporichthyaceae bacterium]
MRGLGGALLGAVAARVALTRWRGVPPGDLEWDRTNHRGDTVSLLAGPAFVLGAAAGAVVAPGACARARAATAVAVLGAGAIGHYDDHRAGTGGQAKGLAGHFRALAHGRFTTGAAKVVGLGAVGAVAGALLPPPGAARRGDLAVATGVVAGFANLANLLDLRPGRCLKFGLLHAPVLLHPGGAALAGPLGAAVGLLDTDLRERTMLGDTGSNAVGAALGVAVLSRYGRIGRLAHLGALCALTLASERISFTEYIAAHEPLRRLDELGRLPSPA